MYVHLELENGNGYPQRVSCEEPATDLTRARARSGHRLFLVLLIVVLTVVLVLEVAGSAYEAGVRPDTGTVLPPDAPTIEPGPSSDLPGTSSSHALDPIRISGGSLPIAR